MAGEVKRPSALAAMLLQFRIAQVMTVFVSAAFLLLAPYILKYAFGASFMPAEQTSYWLIGALGIMGLNGILDNGFRALHRPWAGDVDVFGRDIHSLVRCGMAVARRGNRYYGQNSLSYQLLPPCSTGCTLLLAVEDEGFSDIWGIRLEVFRFLLTYLRLLTEKIFTR